MHVLRFEVFGKPLSVERAGGAWVPYWPGADGKRRRAEFEIPPSIAEEGLCQYLADLFHECATLDHPDVIRVG